MALESQGIHFRRKSTVTGTTGSVASTDIVILTGGTVNSILHHNVAGNFLTSGFATGQRITIVGDTTVNNKNTNVYTVITAAATIMTVVEPLTTYSTVTQTTLTLEGHRFDNIGEVKTVSGPSGSAAIIDITHLGSTAKEKLIGIRDEGQISLSINLDKANATSQHTGLINDRANRTKQTFDIKFTDASATAMTSTTQPTAIYFDAYVPSFSISAAVDNVVSADITLEITSAIKWINKVTS